MRRLAATLALLAAAAHGADTRRSGYDDMSPATQALQRDELQNPAQLWVKDGEERFATDCARCHAPASMKGVAARHPAWEPAWSRPATLADRINRCRMQRLTAPAWPPEAQALLAIEAYLGSLSKGLPIAPPDDPRLAPWVERGRAIYQRRIGQLDFSCAQCHDQLAGGRLGASVIPQGHPTGYPIYRLEWQGLGSLQRRLRNCMTGVRAEPYAAESPEFVALELYLKRRAAGMAVETPAVRP
jgi:L-cysteine S-thiosulfotransferase